MWNIGKFNVVLCVLLLGSCKLLKGIRLKVGPLPDETGRYVYQSYNITGVYRHHCRYCPDGAFGHTEENIRTQEPSCITKYDDIKKQLTPFERINHKIPICKIGEIPGCGPPSEERERDGYIWSCDPGFSNVNHSVYFSCALICEKSRAVAFVYYCNERLQWQQLSTNFTSVASEVDTPSNGIFNGVIKKDEGGSQKLSAELIIVGVGGALVIGCLVAVVVVVVAVCNSHKRKGNGARRFFQMPTNVDTVTDTRKLQILKSNSLDVQL